MDAGRPVSRRSALDSIVAPEQQPCRSSSLGSGTGKSKRYSWSFIRSNSSRSSKDAPPRRNRDPASLLSPPVDESKGRSTSPARSPLHIKANPESVPERPRSSHGFKFRVPNFSRTLPPRGSTLPTIMESKGISSAEMLKSRISSSKVKLWDGRTRTTVSWDGLRRVGLFPSGTMS
jgi:hypothetical protein